jgi:hypothetical protein
MFPGKAFSGKAHLMRVYAEIAVSGRHFREASGC